MKNFEERMAEISRRSEKILALRKKRRRMIWAVCIPMVLCLGILALTGPTGTESKQASMATIVPKPEAADGTSIQCSVAENESLRLFLEQLEGQNDLNYNFIYPEASESEDYGERYCGSGSMTNLPAESLTINVTMSDGSMNEYRLTGSILENLTTGKVFVLTAEQASQLNQLLTEP